VVCVLSALSVLCVADVLASHTHSQGNLTLTPAAATSTFGFGARFLLFHSLCAKRQTAAANFAHLLINNAIIAVANVRTRSAINVGEAANASDACEL
jgi:hypothetical protein